MSACESLLGKIKMTENKRAEKNTKNLHQLLQSGMSSVIVSVKASLILKSLKKTADVCKIQTKDSECF